MLYFQNVTVAEVARRFGVSGTRIRHIEQKTLNKLLYNFTGTRRKHPPRLRCSLPTVQQPEPPYYLKPEFLMSEEYLQGLKVVESIVPPIKLFRN